MSNSYRDVNAKRHAAGKTYAEKAHPGFAGAAKSIEDKEGVSKESADAILASSTRNASKGAKEANPKLKKVK